MSNEYILDLLKEANVDVADKIPETDFIDTGSYALNALVSGSIYGGIPGNRAVMFAGLPSAGKSYLTLSCVKTFMDENPDASVLYFDTEFALEEEMVEKRGINTDKFHIIQTETLEDFRTKALNILDKYEKLKTKPKMLFALDSLSNLPTKKEVDDSMSGHGARDMTKAQIIRSIFRVLTSKLGKNGVPMLICSHVYSSMDMYSPVQISGGCLVAGTKIQMSDGSLKNVEEIEVGDKVKTLNDDSYVTEIFEFDKEIFEIEFEDGYKVKCSPEHKFLVSENEELFWVEAKHLTENMEVITK